MLGQRVRMLGFTRFRGGLDAKSTLLPYPLPPQRHSNRSRAVRI
jgi:hypothetical protein